METRTKMEITNDLPRLDGGKLLEALQFASRLVGTISPNALPPYIETAPNGDYRITDLNLAQDDLINATRAAELIANSVRGSLSTASEYMGYKSREYLLDYFGVEDTPDATYCELAALCVEVSSLSFGAAFREIAQWRGMQASPFIRIED